MASAGSNQLLSLLSARRKELRMPIAALVRRSGVSRPTVCRLLKGNYAQASFVHVAALAEALGMMLDFHQVPAADFVRQQAEERAKEVVRLVQGNMALESQAVDSEGTSKLFENSCNRLLNGKIKKLW